MTDVDREQLKRDCADALEALTKGSARGPDPGVGRLTAGPWGRVPIPWGADARRARDGNQNTITWHLIHVLEKLEQGVT